MLSACLGGCSEEAVRVGEEKVACCCCRFAAAAVRGSEARREQAQGSA